MQSPFADFVVTRGSQRTLAGVRALLDRKVGPRLMLLYGPPGVGKSHLLRAARLECGESCRNVTVSDLVREVITGGRGHPEERLLTVDDLHVLAGMPRTQIELGRYLEKRCRASVRVLAAAGASLTELPQLTERLLRIEGTVLVEMRPPTPREMAEILLFEASRAGVRVDATAVRRIATRCGGDVRRAQGAVAHLRLTGSLAT